VRHGFGSLAWAIPGVLIAYSTLAAAEFHESFDETRPPPELFQGQLFVGDADGWTGEVKKGTYFLIDRETPGAIKAIVLPKPVTGTAKITVTIFGQFEGEKAGAGLAYGFKPDGGYYVFVVTPNQGYALYRVGGDELQPISKGTNKAIQVASVNRLSVELKGSEAVLSVNGERVYGHSAEGGTPLQGHVGIVAIDRGAYSFDDFSLTEGGK
jgi:hypothetical protein